MCERALAMGKNRAQNLRQNNNGYVCIIVGSAKPFSALPFHSHFIECSRPFHEPHSREM